MANRGWQKGLARPLIIKNKISSTIRTHLIENDSKRYNVNKDGCWVWKLRIMANGYGQLTRTSLAGKKTHTAHRYFYEKYKGEIPKGYDVHHKCFNRACVNPEHLDAIPAHVNRSIFKSRPYSMEMLKGVCCETCIEKIKLIKKTHGE